MSSYIIGLPRSKTVEGYTYSVCDFGEDEYDSVMYNLDLKLLAVFTYLSETVFLILDSIKSREYVNTLKKVYKSKEYTIDGDCYFSHIYLFPFVIEYYSIYTTDIVRLVDLPPDRKIQILKYDNPVKIYTNLQDFLYDYGDKISEVADES